MLGFLYSTKEIIKIQTDNSGKSKPPLQADAERLEKKRKKQEAKEKQKGKLDICVIMF